MTDLAQLDKAWDFKKWAAQSVLPLRVQLTVTGNFFAEFFSLIQFWQIWQNDLFTDKLEWVTRRVSQGFPK